MAKQSKALAPNIPFPNEAFLQRYEDLNLSQETWRTLVNVLYPSATSMESVAMMLGYCKANKLDPFKKPVHIVPVWDSKKNCMVDTVWPGISFLLTIAHRTGQFAGKTQTSFGRKMTETFEGKYKDGKGNWIEESVKLQFPEWAQVTVYRMVNGEKCEFEGDPVYFKETYAKIQKSELPNRMWRDRTRGQLGKCALAQALRIAFPEEIGSDYAAEEMEGRSINEGFNVPQSQSQPEPIKEYKLMGDDGEGVADARGKTDVRNEDEAGRSDETDGNETTSGVIDADWQDEEEGEFLENLTKETDHEMPNYRWEVLEPHFERLKSIAENSGDGDNKQQAIELLDVYEQDKGSAK